CGISPPIRPFVLGHKGPVVATSEDPWASRYCLPVPGTFLPASSGLLPTGPSARSCRLLREPRNARNMCRKSDRVKRGDTRPSCHALGSTAGAFGKPSGATDTIGRYRRIPGWAQVRSPSLSDARPEVSDCFEPRPTLPGQPDRDPSEAGPGVEQQP